MPAKGQLDPNASERSKYQRKYNSKPSSKKDRASRNAARREAMEDGKVSKGDGKDIDHRNHRPRDNSKSNLRVISASKNRSMNRHKT